MWIKRTVFLVLISLLIVLFVIQANSAPSLLQYVFVPAQSNLMGRPARQEGGEQEEETPAREEPSPFERFLAGYDELVESQRDNLNAAVLSAHLPAVSQATEDNAAAGELTALYGDLHALDPKLLLSGRLLYQEDLEEGKPVAVIDEGLAIALFRQGDPVNMVFQMLGQQFTVVGVTRHKRSVGDRAEYGLMVPLKAFATQPAWEVMSVQMRSKGGSGTRTGLAKVLEQWQAGGNAIDLVKEKYRASLPLRVLLCLLGMAGALVVLRFAARQSARLVAKTREWLKVEYAQRLLHRYLGVGLVIFLMYLTGVGLLVFSFTQLLAPVYVFPEWVPAILVEPKEIAATFWNNQSAANSLLSLRSRELLFLDAIRGYILILTALAGAFLITPLGKLLKVFKKTE